MAFKIGDTVHYHDEAYSGHPRTVVGVYYLRDGCHGVEPLVLTDFCGVRSLYKPADLIAGEPSRPDKRVDAVVGQKVIINVAGRSEPVIVEIKP